MDEILRELDVQPDDKYIEQVKEAMGESLATKYMDYTKIKEITARAKEYRLIPEYVEEFFKKAFTHIGGKIRQLKDNSMAIDFVPHELRRIGKRTDFQNSYGKIQTKYPRVTFDKDVAFKRPELEFISFGHPLFEALLEFVKTEFKDMAQKGAVFKDPSGRLDGYICFYIGEVQDGKGDIAGRRIFAIYYDGKGFSEINPAILWDLSLQKSANNFDLNDLPEENKFLQQVIESIKTYKKELEQERKRQAEIKRKYGLKSLDILINDLDLDLARLYERQDKGEKVELPISNKEERKKHYEKAKENLEREIILEQSLSFSMPDKLSIIRIVSDKCNMIENQEIEKIGMEIAMKYEKKQGRTPEDVSVENLGFDIRSRDKKTGEIRYIEVKARAKEGEVALTPNEWFKAKRFKKEYWLYVVTNAATNPVLYIINNPAENLIPQEKMEIVRLVIPVDEWKNKKKEVWYER